ncbi:ABC transporter substrate-binding protein [Albitalea terrae]|uniref:ABC transporter substrate-binding protein n=2 Tax=Piscinibacter terrae TaxID=2496871 RepID=A0A3N7HRH7_9BURK|nr:ABC transporter substrate-binding protein [Albitalea terrae]
MACASAGLLASAFVARAQPTLRLARLENVPDQAIGAEILVAVYHRAGIGVSFVDLPAKRSLLESSEGRVDGEVQRILAVQDQYPTLIAAHPSFNFIEPTAFVTDAEVHVDGWGSISGHSIGIVRGVGSSERGTAGMDRVEAVATMEQLMQSLAARRFEVAVNDRFSGLLVARRLKLDHAVRPLSPPLERIPLHHFVHERHRELLPKIEKAIRDMQSSGELEKVRQQAMARLLKDAER